MRAIKRINNNAAICVDGSGRQLIALGRGVGFGDMPREVSLKDVKRTFYGVDPKYLSFIDEVDPDILEFSAQFADIVTQQLSYELSSNLPITLADHIQFAIKRAREHMVVSMPLAVDVEQAHPVEYRLAEIALKGIQRTFGVRMPKGEAAGIALSIVSSAVGSSARTAELSERTDRLLAGIVQIVEADMGVKVDQSSFAYTRFTTHLRYLLDRIAKGKPVESENLGPVRGARGAVSRSRGVRPAHSGAHFPLIRCGADARGAHLPHPPRQPDYRRDVGGGVTP